MTELIILITVSFIFFLSPFLASILRIPIAPIEISLGVLAGYFGFLQESHLFELVAELGFFYLMFLAGTEVDLKALLKIDKNTFKLSVLYLFLLYLFSFIFTKSFNLGYIFVVILPLISVGMILTLFKEYGKDQEWLNLGMTVGTLGEVISIALLTFVSAMLEFGIGYELYRSIGFLCLFLFSFVLIFKLIDVLFWWFPKVKIILMPHYDKDEKDIRLSMALFFLIIALMLYFHLEIAFGAFVAGTFIATFFEHKQELPHKLASFGFGFLVPTFFIYVGSTFELSSLSKEGVLLNGFLITLLSIAIRIVSSLVFIKQIGLLRSILLGFSHSMPFTLVIAVATIAYKSQTITQGLYFSFVLVSMFEVIIAMMAIKFLVKLDKKQAQINAE